MQVNERKPLPEGITSRMVAGIEYLNLTQAAAYAGYSVTGFRKVLDAAKKKSEKEQTSNPLRVWQFGDGRDRYVKRSDLDDWLSPQEAE